MYIYKDEHEVTDGLNVVFYNNVARCIVIVDSAIFICFGGGLWFEGITKDFGRKFHFWRGP